MGCGSIHCQLRHDSIYCRKLEKKWGILLACGCLGSFFRDSPAVEIRNKFVLAGRWQITAISGGLTQRIIRKHRERVEPRSREFKAFGHPGRWARSGMSLGRQQGHRPWVPSQDNGLRLQRLGSSSRETKYQASYQDKSFRPEVRNQLPALESRQGLDLNDNIAAIMQYLYSTDCDPSSNLYALAMLVSPYNKPMG